MPGEKGVSLLIVIIVIILFSLFGYISLSMLSTGTRRAIDYLNSEKAFHIAEAGIQIALRKLRDNWDNWKNPNNFPSGYLDEGRFDLSVYDDEDDLDPNFDSNNCIIIESAGSYKQAKRKIKVYVDRKGLFDSAICSNNLVNIKSNAVEINGNVFAFTISDPHNCINGEKNEGNTFLPELDLNWFRAQAQANPLNGRGASGNYFTGKFDYNFPSLNGVIYIDTYAGGNTQHDVKISGNIITEPGEGNPAVLIVNGDLKITGTVQFNGLIYVTGEVMTDSDIGGNVEISGMIISNGSLDVFGNAGIDYKEEAIPDTVKQHIYGFPNIFNFKEISVGG